MRFFIKNLTMEDKITNYCEEWEILLVKRGIHPFKDSWALPGGFLRSDESVEECAFREIVEETGIEPVSMKHVGVFSDCDRDPRGRIISNAFTSIIVDGSTDAHSGDDANDAKWFEITFTEQSGLYYLNLTNENIILKAVLKEIRNEFTIDEWIDVLLGAIDYNPAGYEATENKLTMLTRLLPFVEKRVNLIELAPKGTGKSYLFGNISKYSCISSGGVMSRAKMFYDISKNREGLITGYDLLTMDEVQTVTFPDVEEMAGAMKAYLEQGFCVIAGHKIVGDSGVVLCGNIRKEIMDADGYSNMFGELPEIFHESALIDRFHGFIKGWNIPRMNDDLKANGWALNSEYFCSIMHELRNDMTYRSIVDELIIVPDGADTRDTEAVKRIATAYMKLLFPNVQRIADISPIDFKHYCLDRAMKMRDTIRYQLGLLDVEYRGKDLPVFKIRGMQ